jgi:pimeloyl-ACP methyl ester carboxylesterase
MILVVVLLLVSSFVLFCFVFFFSIVWCWFGITVGREVEGNMNLVDEVFPFWKYLTQDTIKYAFCIFVAVWTVLELLFAFIIIKYVAPHLQRFRKPVATQIPPLQFFQKIFDTIDILPDYTFSNYISGFFHGAPLEDIYQDNLASFIAWGIFGKRLGELNADEQIRIKELLDYTAVRFPILNTVKPGFNPDVSHCAITLEPVRYFHRPLFLYVGNALVEMFFHNAYLRVVGFQFLETEDMTYWIKEGRNSALPPMLIYHGISSGWLMYALVIQTFLPNRTVILADLDAVKIKSMYFHMPSMDRYNAAILRVLRRHHIDKVSIVGHSFGTITASWLASKHPEVVSHITLMDPVSLLLCLPDVVENFIYRSLRKCRSPVEAIIWFFAAREITISYALHRNFIWHYNTLWLQDVPSNIGVVIGLATKDEITNPRLQQQYIDHCVRHRESKSQSANGQEQAKISTVIWQNYSHGQILMSAQTMETFREIVQANEKHDMRYK